MYLGLVVLLLSTILLGTCIWTSHMPPLWRTEILTIATSFGSIMFASSYVEEEHQFWYWIAASHFVLAYLQRFELPGIATKEASILAHRRQVSNLTLFYFNYHYFALSVDGIRLVRNIMRAFLTPGQKFAGAPDIVKNFLQHHPHFLGILVISTYILAGCSLYRNAFPRNDAFRRIIWPIILVCTSVVFKITMAAEAGERLPIWLQHIPYIWSWAASLVSKARVSFITMALALVWYSIRWVTDLKTSQSWITGGFAFLNIFLLGQSRYTNIPLFLLFESQRWLLARSNADVNWLAMTCLWMQHVSFFALGNSNSLSSVDLTNAYNGMSSYSIPLVGALTFISNWAGPIWWTFAAVRFHVDCGTKRAIPGSYIGWMGWNSLFHGVVICFLVLACIALKTHLFIWTVFSPKFLFQAVWITLQHIVVEFILGSILCWLG